MTTSGVLLLLSAAFLAGVTVSVTLVTGVPTWPANRRLRRAAAGVARTLLAGRDRPVVADLGAGTGDLLLALGQALPRARLIGMELSPVPWLVARLRLRAAGHRGVPRWGTFFRRDWSEADLLLLYLSRQALARAAVLLERRAAPGAHVVSLVFAVESWTPVEVVTVDDVWRSRLYVYRLPGAEPASPGLSPGAD